MKRTGTIFFLASLLLAGACTRTPVPGDLPAVRLIASVPGETRGTVAATAAEKAITHVDWFVAAPDGTVSSSRGTAATELLRLDPGEYGFMAVANLPAAAPAVGDMTIGEYREALEVSFQDCFDESSSQGFVMVSPLVTVSVDSDADIRLDMERVAAKVEMTGGITFDFPSGSSGDLAEKSILSVFLINIPETVKVCGGGMSGSAYVNDAFIRSAFIPAYVTEAGLPTAAMNACTKWTGSGDKVFYAHPNAALQADSVEESDHTTKLVVAASIGGIVQYYPISLPGLASNKIVRVGNIRISGYGSEDPNAYVQDRSGLSFEVVSLIPWTESEEEYVLVRKD